jgi:hypothetical protein
VYLTRCPGVADDIYVDSVSYVKVYVTEWQGYPGVYFEHEYGTRFTMPRPDSRTILWSMGPYESWTYRK